MRDQAAKNVLMKDGTVRRRPANECEQLLDSGQAKHYVSNTVRRAVKLGIEVKDFKTRDQDGKLRGLIRDARQKAEKRAEKKVKKDAQKAEEASSEET